MPQNCIPNKNITALNFNFFRFFNNRLLMCGYLKSWTVICNITAYGNKSFKQDLLSININLNVSVFPTNSDYRIYISAALLLPEFIVSYIASVIADKYCRTVFKRCSDTVLHYNNTVNSCNYFLKTHSLIFVRVLFMVLLKLCKAYNLRYLLWFTCCIELWLCYFFHLSSPFSAICRTPS